MSFRPICQLNHDLDLLCTDGTSQILRDMGLSEKKKTALRDKPDREQDSMDKVIVKYPGYGYIGMLFVPVLCILLYLFLAAVFDSFGPALVAITIIIMLIVEFFLWQYTATKIILTDEGLSINKPFRNNKFLWSEISEFGKYRQRFSRVNEWHYYIKSFNCGEKKFMLGERVLNDINKMCSIIFERAIKAKFVMLQSNSPIPFMGNYEVIAWKRDKDTKETYF